MSVELNTLNGIHRFANGEDWTFEQNGVLNIKDAGGKTLASIAPGGWFEIYRVSQSDLFASEVAAEVRAQLKKHRADHWPPPPVKEDSAFYNVAKKPSRWRP